MATYWVILADDAYHTAEVIGVHSSRKIATAQANGRESKEYYRPRVITGTQKQRGYRHYRFYA